MEIDHVLIAVRGLQEAARGLELQHGLASVDGGRHPGLGTANRIVPLGEAYLELVAVVDPDEARESAFGRWVGQGGPGPARLLGWAVRTDRLDEVAGRLGLTVAGGSRAAPDGRLVRWRLAGIDRAATEPTLPFFIEWAPGTPLPGGAEAAHPAGAVRIERLELAGDADRLGAWLGPHRLPVAVRAGPPAVTGVVLRGSGGEIALDPVRFSAAQPSPRGVSVSAPFPDGVK